MEHNEIYKNAINKWGKEIQIEIAIEEMAELIKALQKIKRSTGQTTEWINLIHNVCEEIADVEIMIEQLKLIFPNSIVMDYKIGKIDRLKQRLN
jgi:NTP pyrophosphatase (non-canonical NTP hydrolase)